MLYKKILLVGGTGYLGRHLATYIKTVSDSNIYITGSKNIDCEGYFQIDFNDAESFNNIRQLEVDIVIVLASKLGSLGVHNLNHPDLQVNTIGYSSFLQYLSNNGIAKKIIYTSSMTVYSPENINPIIEYAKINPVNTYGLSKYIAEVITNFFCVKNNISGVILRLPGIYGGDKKNGFIYNTIQNAKANKLTELDTTGLIYWETIFINDLCEMIWEFMKKYEWKLPMDIFNVSYGCETDFNATAEFIISYLQKGEVYFKTREKGYVPFYLSNEKIGKLIRVKSNYFGNLEKYIAEINT